MCYLQALWHKKKYLHLHKIYWIKPFDWRNVDCVGHAGAYKHAVPTSKYIIPWLTYAVSAVNCYQVNKVPGGHFPVVNMQQIAVCHMQQLLMLYWIPFTGGRKQRSTFLEHLRQSNQISSSIINLCLFLYKDALLEVQGYQLMTMLS